MGFYSDYNPGRGPGSGTGEGDGDVSEDLCHTPTVVGDAYVVLRARLVKQKVLVTADGPDAHARRQERQILNRRRWSLLARTPASVPTLALVLRPGPKDPHPNGSSPHQSPSPRQSRGAPPQSRPLPESSARVPRTPSPMARPRTSPEVLVSPENPPAQSRPPPGSPAWVPRTPTPIPRPQY